MLLGRVLDDDDLKAGQHEVGIDLALWNEGVVRPHARAIQLEHFAKQLL
jgi:hypothetical protein